LPPPFQKRMAKMVRKEPIFRRLNEYSFVIPVIVTIMFLVVLSLIYGGVVSLYAKTVQGSPSNFVGLNNYMSLLTSSRWWRALIRSFYYTFSAVFIKMVIGFAAAMVVHQKFPGRGILRAVFLIPWTIPLFVTSLMFYFLLEWKGPVNALLNNLLNMSPVNWLGPDLAFSVVILLNIWHGYPFFMISFLAGLQSIPNKLYEAGEVDGCSALQSFLYITIPNLRPVILTTLLLSTLWTFSQFETIYVLTRGGPGYATEVMSIFVFKKAYTEFQVPMAIAAAILTLPLFFFLIFAIERRLSDDMG